MTVLLAACGGGPTSGSVVGTSGTAAPGSTASSPSSTGSTPATVATTAAPVTAPGTSSTSGASGELSEEAQACLDVVHRWVEAVEPAAAGVDFATVGFHDYQLFLVDIVPASQAMIDELSAADCFALPPEDIDPSSVSIVDWARANAPGAVGYLELQNNSAGLDVVGDCASDVDALQDYVDGGGTVGDLTVEERIHAYNLAGAIIQWCSLEVGNRFVSQPEIEAFLEIED
jgi:hypothetical protein